ncbi:hypothetical protein MLD38_037187 [Melastoma candidum]|uniref:Uncharacterized protein n=1 Tax=Melastoma candidum TaxID=119954 RepID=A0ACB9LMB3_9MYRT|nr:hypothetical protein MLD38_037187 [Melastoma candidum]
MEGFQRKGDDFLPKFPFHLGVVSFPGSRRRRGKGTHRRRRSAKSEHTRGRRTRDSKSSEQSLPCHGGGRFNLPLRTTIRVRAWLVLYCCCCWRGAAVAVWVLLSQCCCCCHCCVCKLFFHSRCLALMRPRTEYEGELPIEETRETNESSVMIEHPLHCQNRLYLFIGRVLHHCYACKSFCSSSWTGDDIYCCYVCDQCHFGLDIRCAMTVVPASDPVVTIPRIPTSTDSCTTLLTGEAFIKCVVCMACVSHRDNSSEVQLLDLGNGIGGHTSNDDLQGENPLSSQDMLLMRLSVICAATGDFSEENKLGQGGFGPVYKGVLLDGKEIAVKRLSRASGQGLIELKNEVDLIARLQHRNLVRLLGFCLEQHEMMLVYEYMPNKSLDFFLFDQSKSGSLDWKKRFSIIGGISRGLLYLHEDSRLRIIHRDLKASNILLDHEMNPKISDFGMARIFGVNQDEAATNRVVGTYGYMSPEYAMGGIFSVKSDVFSFGVLLLEIVSGRKNSSFHIIEQGESLLTFEGMSCVDDTLFTIVPNPDQRSPCV